MGIPLARVAARVMLGKSLEEQGLGDGMARVGPVAVKEAALPFAKFPGVDPVLGPEMRSTGEVMGIADNFGLAFSKAQAAVGMPLPKPSEPGSPRKVFCSVHDRDKEDLIDVARQLEQLGFTLVATSGTREALEARGVSAEFIYKLREGRPSIYDAIVNHEVALVINTPLDEEAQRDELYLRRAAVERGVPYVTTISAARAAVEGIRASRGCRPAVCSLQEYHEALARAKA